MGAFYVQFAGENLYEAVVAHNDDPFSSIIECLDFAQESGENIGTSFNVVDENGKIYYSGILTHDGVVEVRPDDLRGGE